MTELTRIRHAAMAMALVVAAAIGGCSAGDVELNGSLFDTLGVGSKSQSSSRNIKTTERQGLVVPPNMEHLPEPGSGSVDAQQASTVMPIDPEQRRVAAAGQAEVQHRAYCDKALRTAKLLKDLSPVVGPLGRCETSILDQINVQSAVQVNAGGPATPPKP